ncbi:MAG: O-antigen ligase family protein [Candidatus Moraniibacteriota bacterium]
MEQTPLSPDTGTTTLWNDPRTYIITGAVFFLIALLAGFLGASLLWPLIAVIGVFAMYTLFHQPLFLLAALIVIRMSLDYSAQYITLNVFDRSFSLSQVLGLGIAVIGGLFILSRWRTLSHSPLVLPYGLIILWGLGTLAYSIAPAMSLQEVLRVFDLFVIGFMAYASVGRYRDYRFLLTAIFVSSILPIIFGLAQFFLGVGLSDENVSATRIFGTFSHPNVFSLYLFTIAAVAGMYGIVYARQDRVRLITGLYLALVLVTLVLTYARIAWISLFVFVFLVVLWRYRFLILPLILLPLVLVTFVPAVQERVTEALHPTPDSSIVWRQNLWRDMLLKARLEDRVALGSGIDTFRVSAEALRGERFGSNESHNDFVKFYIDGGMVGLVVYGLYLLVLFFPVLKVRRLTPSHSLKNLATLLALLMVTLVIASLSDNVFKNTPVQWILASVTGGFLALYHHSYRPSEA